VVLEINTHSRSKPKLAKADLATKFRRELVPKCIAGEISQSLFGGGIAQIEANILFPA